MQRILHFIQLEGLDDGLNLLHRSRPIMGVAPNLFRRHGSPLP
jgi:hypothetical protein